MTTFDEGSKPSKTAMITAVKAWNAAAVERIAAANPNLVTATDKRGRTPLHLACAVRPSEGRMSDRYGIATADVLLSRGAKLEAVESIPDDGEVFHATPLWYAVARGVNLPLVKHLLRLGARADYCLWAVVWRDDAEMCKALLSSKPKLDLVFSGETPLFYAARLRRLRTLKLLLDAGADCSIKGPAGEAVAEIARRRRLPAPVVERLRQAHRRRRTGRRRR